MLKSCIGATTNDTSVHSQDSASQSHDKEKVIVKANKTIDSNFFSYWNEFTSIIKASNLKEFRNMSFDSIECNEQVIGFNEFMQRHYKKVFDDTLLSKFNENKNIDFIPKKVDAAYYPSAVQKAFAREGHMAEQVNVTKNDKYPDIVIAIFEFIKTDNGYKFYGYSTIGE